MIFLVTDKTVSPHSQCRFGIFECGHCWCSLARLPLPSLVLSPTNDAHDENPGTLFTASRREGRRACLPVGRRSYVG